jgi:hypothetical protein
LRQTGTTRIRLVAVLVVVAVFGTISASAANSATGETPAAPDVGITPTEIHIAVVADAALVPGVNDAAQGFARYVNASCPTKDRCLAGRKLVVDSYDSGIDPTKTRNAEIQACGNDFAMVGTSAFRLESVTDMRDCKDHAGKTIGIPDIPFFAGPVVQQCSDESFPVLPIGLHCATKNQHPQTYDSQVGRGFYYIKKYGPLHGIYLFSSDSKDGNNDERIGDGGLSDIGGAGLGIRSDHDFAVSYLAPQSVYTTFVEAMKVKGSDYAQCGQPYSCTVLLRTEATTQGIADQVKVWDCLTCYDKAFLQTGVGVDSTYVDTGYLPFYDAKEQSANPMLANFVRYTGADKVDASGIYAWAAGIAFRDAVNATVKSHGLNGLTRANLYTVLNAIHTFDADGMVAPHDFASRKVSDCHVLTQVRNGHFVRVEPTKPGTFDCNPKYVITRKLDLTSGQ